MEFKFSKQTLWKVKLINHSFKESVKVDFEEKKFQNIFSEVYLKINIIKSTKRKQNAHTALWKLNEKNSFTTSTGFLFA